VIKFKIKNASIDKIESDIRRKAEALIKNPEILNELADTVIQDIKYQTKRGVSAKTGERLMGLSDSWKKRRAKIASSISTGELFSVNRSNLTLSGQLLDSISKKISSVVTIFFDGDHMPYRVRRKDGTGSYNVGERIKNEKLAEYVQEKRPFFAVRDSLIPRLKKIVIKYIRRNI
jgi:hypothetical protein